MKQKTKSLISLNIFLAIFALITPQSLFAELSPTDEATQKQVHLTFQIIISETASGMEKRAFDRDIIKDQKRSKKESKRVLYSKVKAGLILSFKKEFEETKREVDVGYPKTIDSWFSQQQLEGIYAKRKVEAEKAIEKNMKTNFDSEFERARKEVVEEQRRSLADFSYPTVEEIEYICNEDKSEKAYNKLKNRLVAEAVRESKKANRVVYEENHDWLEGKIDEIIKDGNIQLGEQMGIVANYAEGEAVTPKGIAEELLERINSYRDRLDKEKKKINKNAGAMYVPEKVYPVFSSVEKKIGIQKNRIAVKKFTLWMAEFPMEINIPEFKKEWMINIISANPKEHSDEEESRQKFIELLFPPARRYVLDKYIKESKVPKGEVGSFKTFLQQQEKLYKKDIDILIDRKMNENFESARDEVSDMQLEKYFKPLALGSWQAEYKEIELNYYKPDFKKEEDPFSRKSIFSKSIKANRSDLINETYSKVVDRVEILLTEGVSALRKQMFIVDQVEKEYMSNRYDMDISLPGLVADYTERVAKIWSINRIDLMWGDSKPPPNKNTKYADLFPMVIEEIKRRAKTLLPILEAAKTTEQEKTEMDDLKKWTDRHEEIVEEVKKSMPKLEDMEAFQMEEEYKNKQKEDSEKEKKEGGGKEGEGGEDTAGTGDTDESGDQYSGDEGEGEGDPGSGSEGYGAGKAGESLYEYAVNAVFEVSGVPKTKYFRTSVGEVYDSGKWEMAAGAEKVNYQDDYTAEQDEANKKEELKIKIKPVKPMSGFIPVELHMTEMNGFKDIDHYPAQQIFKSSAAFEHKYEIKYGIYEYSDELLKDQEVSSESDNLQVPDNLMNKVEKLAQRITKAAGSPYEKMQAIVYFLQKNYRLSKKAEAVPEGKDPLEMFLFENKSGPGFFFNSAFTVLARSIGIPSRTFSGYNIDPDADYQIVYEENNYLWSEVRFKDIGWYAMDVLDYEHGPEPDIFIEVNTKNTEITIDIKYHEKDKPGLQFSVSTLNMEDMQKGMIANKSAMKKNFRGFLEERGLIPVYVLVRMNYESRIYGVPYGLVYDFRQSLAEAYKDIGEGNVELYWYDEAYKKEGKEEVKDFPDIGDYLKFR